MNRNEVLVMKVRKIHLWLFVLLLTVVAVVPRVGAQGDFMTLSLGESQTVVQTKLDALERARQIEITSAWRFTARIMDEPVECSVNFFQGKLFQVLILFRGTDGEGYHHTLKRDLEERINPAITQNIGVPSVVRPYPDIAEVDNLLGLVAEWDIPGKAVLSGVIHDETGYHAKIEIYDNRLGTARNVTG
jgi:hypothetical protein